MKMGLRSSPGTGRSIVIAATLAIFGQFVIQGASQAGSMTFLVPREVVLRHNGAPIRAGMKSMSPDEVVVVLRTGVEKSYAMSAVTSVVAADKTFQYYPAQETFDEFLVKAALIRGVTIVRDDGAGSAGGSGAGGDSKTLGGVSEGYARMIGMQPAAMARVTSSGGGFAQASGFAGASQRPQGLARLEPPVIPELDRAVVTALEQQRKAAEIEAATPKFALPGGGVAPVTPLGTGGSFALPPAGEEVLICSNSACGKEVPGAKYGQKCPHCGVTWAHQSTGDIIASAGNSAAGPVVDPKNPFAKAPPAPVPNAMAMPPQPMVAPAAAAAAPPEGLTLDTIPWWGKVLGFGASIMVLMWVLGRR